LKSYILLSSFLILLFSACSTKEVYKPKELSTDWDKYGKSGQYIIDTSSNVALLENRKVLSQTETLNVEIEESKRVISQSSAWVLSASIDGNLTLTSENNDSIQEHFELKKTIASASVKDDTLAVLFADNEIALFSVSGKNTLFREQGAKYLAADSRIVNPYFMKGLVLFATLDGKVIIVNENLKKRLRTVIVSSEDNFNNIISLNIVKGKIVAATSYKILSMSKKEIRVKYEIRNIVYDDETIYLSTKQGEVVSLTSELQVNLKVKFPFAHFYGMIGDDENLYLLEKEGYMIVINKSTFDYTVHEVDFDDGFIFVADKLFYVSDELILTK